MYAIKSKDLITTMRDLVELNVKHYKTDFSYDVQHMCYSAYRHEKETFIFMTRECGTYLFDFESCVLANSHCFNTIQYYVDEKDEHPRIYFIEVDGFESTYGNIYGTIYEAPYEDFANWLDRNKIESVDMYEYNDGSIVPESAKHLFDKSNLKRIYCTPKSKLALETVTGEAERIRWDNPNFVDMAEYRYNFKI